MESASARFLPPEVRDRFLSIASTAEDFALDHGLHIDRYRKGKPAWELTYARQDGAIGSITLSAREPSWHAMDVVAVFWLDDWPTRSRRLRSEKVGVYFWRDSPERLVEQLHAALARLDSWSLDDLGKAYGPFKDWPADEADFVKSRTQLPLR